MKKLLSIILCVIWCLIIFNFSNNNGDDSQSLSDKVIIRITAILTDIKENTDEMNRVVDKYSFIVRKSAHFFVYFILGFLVMNALFTNGVYKKTIIYSVIFCILYAISDEVHQLFIDGRAGSIKDVLLDSSASILSSYLFSRFIIIRSLYGKSK